MSDHNWLVRVFEIGQRVQLIRPDIDARKEGVVIGCASDFPVFYIVLLDKPLDEEPFVGWTGLSVPGSMLLPVNEKEKTT